MDLAKKLMQLETHARTVSIYPGIIFNLITGLRGPISVLDLSRGLIPVGIKYNGFFFNL